VALKDKKESERRSLNVRFEKSAQYDEICRKKFPADIYQQLKRAFFMKRENLDREHEIYRAEK
jgi:hypothetical protein